MLCYWGLQKLMLWLVVQRWLMCIVYNGWELWNFSRKTKSCVLDESIVSTFNDIPNWISHWYGEITIGSEEVAASIALMHIHRHRHLLWFASPKRFSRLVTVRKSCLIWQFMFAWFLFYRCMYGTETLQSLYLLCLGILEQLIVWAGVQQILTCWRLGVMTTRYEYGV